MVEEDDEHWELTLLLLSCMDIIFSSAVTKGDTVYLSHLINDHHSLYIELFPDISLKPKHHFITHYQSAILWLGPLIHLWVMRFEAFHNFSKRLAHIVCNFQNISKTLSYRSSMHLCHNIMAKKSLSEKPHEIGPGGPIILASLECAEQLSDKLQIPMLGKVVHHLWNQIQGAYDGCHYKKQGKR